MPAISKTTEKSFYALALGRIGIGLIFLWAFFDKLFGLGFATCRDKISDAVNTGCSQAWIHGGSPTSGFLGHAVSGPFAGAYHQLTGRGWVDWLFMLGLLFIGVGLILGVAVYLSALTGSLLLLLMWSARLWPADNPVLDEHIIYVFVLLAVFFANANQRWGLRDRWRRTALVKALPFLE